jgi:KTSC domain
VILACRRRAPDEPLCWNHAGGLRRWVAMAREYVDSTSIEWFDYHFRQRTIDLAFSGGDVYRYHDVPPNVRDGLRAADSKGSYVNTVIKPQYRYTRLTNRRGNRRVR